VTTTAKAARVDEAEPLGKCWCCGAPNPPTNLIRLDEHREVALCLRCAHWLALCAKQRRDELQPSLAGRARDVLRAARRTVVDHGWQRRSIVGAALRWIGRHTP
jgi:hypothetical protein